jgi:hypothetical protein
MSPVRYPLALVLLALVTMSALPVLGAEPPSAEKPPADGEQPSCTPGGG